MDNDLTARIVKDPRYQQLKSQRSRFGWLLAVAMLIVYYGFILLVAFNKPLLATRLGEGVTTIGMPLGLGVIVFTIVITGIYVRRANKEYDDLTEQITRGVLK
jgi:uncharacterized membrane protein (DUF485 family)